MIYETTTKEMEQRKTTDIKVSLMLPINTTNPFHQFQEHLIVKADQLGFEGIWLRDIIISPQHSNDIGTGYEIITYLSYLAGITKNVRLGSAVLSMLCRNEIITAKQIASIDQLSKGRLDIGFGYGDRPLELDYFNVNIENKNNELASKIETIKLILKNGYLHQKNKEKCTVLPPPYQKKVPMWMAIKSFKQCDNKFNYLSYFKSLTEFKEEIDSVREDFSQKGMLFWVSLSDSDLQDDPLLSEGERFPVIKGTSYEVLQTLKQYRKAGLNLALISFVGPKNIEQQMERFAKVALPYLNN
jgi:hypothetical protein